MLRNDLGVPLRLGCCRTDLVTGAGADWVRRRALAACEELGQPASLENGRVVVTW